MVHRDLREFVELLRSEGDLAEVKAEVDWNIEMATISRNVSSQEGQALLFSNIKDYKNGDFRRVFLGGMSAERRMAMALGLPKSSTYKDVVRTIKDRLLKPIKPVVVSTGPVKENILKGDDVDLSKIPVPLLHHFDGGRYIDTLATTVTRDPETGDLNLGTYRGMIVDKNHVAKLLSTTAHWGQHYAKYRARGEPMPVAVCYGNDPTIMMCSASAVQHPRGTSEYDFAGGLKQSAIEVVKCETSDLLVPARSEIVVEGLISVDPKDYRPEGPFGEYPGTYGGLESPKPTIEVKCITYRNDPIYTATDEGNSPGRWSESAYFATPMSCALAWNALESAGVPNVLDVWGNPVSCGNNLRVRIKKLYRGHAKQVACALWGTSIVIYIGKSVIVVDDDIDIHSDEAVDWALSYRVNAGMDDIQFLHNCFGSMLDPSVPLRERNVEKYGQGKSSRVLVDATVNWELEPEPQYGGKRFPPLCTYPEPQDQALVEKRWKEYGIAGSPLKSPES